MLGGVSKCATRMINPWARTARAGIYFRQRIGGDDGDVRQRQRSRQTPAIQRGFAAVQARQSGITASRQERQIVQS